MEESSKKTIEPDERLLYSSSSLGRGGYVVGQTTIIGEANAVALITPMEDGMILSMQVVPLEATKEVEENKVVEEPIITTREDVGIADSKDMSKHIVQPNKHMS